MMKLTCSIFIFSNNHLKTKSKKSYIKMCNDSSAKHYQNNKERLQKSLSRISCFSKIEEE